MGHTVFIIFTNGHVVVVVAACFWQHWGPDSGLHTLGKSPYCGAIATGHHTDTENHLHIEYISQAEGKSSGFMIGGENKHSSPCPHL